MANSGVFWQIRGVPFFHDDRDGAVDHQDFSEFVVLWSGFAGRSRLLQYKACNRSGEAR